MKPLRQEKRREPRALADFPIRLGEDGSIPARLKNISRSGLCCVVPQPLPEMTIAQTSIELPTSGEGTRTYRIEGAVVRCEPLKEGGFEVAIFFQFPPEEARNLIGDFVAKSS